MSISELAWLINIDLIVLVLWFELRILPQIRRSAAVPEKGGRE